MPQLPSLFASGESLGFGRAIMREQLVSTASFFPKRHRTDLHSGTWPRPMKFVRGFVVGFTQRPRRYSAPFSSKHALKLSEIAF